MYIIWDTNVFIRDYHLSGTQSELFLAGFKHLPEAGFGLPEVVRTELLHKYREALEGLLSGAQKACRRLDDFTYVGALSLPDVDIDAAVEQYARALYLSLGVTGFEVLPIPTLDISEALQRAVEKRPPFDAKGRGFRDYLLWRTVLAVLKVLGPPVVLVTENKADFGAGTLKPELAQDLEQLGFPTSAVELFNSLEAFNSRYIRPPLEAAEAFHLSLDSGPVRDALETHLAVNLPEAVDSERLVEALGLPPNAALGALDSVRTVGNIRADDAFRIEPSSYLTDADVVVDGFVRLTFSRADHERSSELRHLIRVAPSDGLSVVTLPVRLGLSLVMLINPDSLEFSDPEVTHLRVIHGTDERAP